MYIVSCQKIYTPRSIDIESSKAKSHLRIPHTSIQSVASRMESVQFLEIDYLEEGALDQAGFQETEWTRSLHVQQSVAVLCTNTTSPPGPLQNHKRHITWWAQLWKSRPRWWPLTCWSSHEPLSLDHTRKRTRSQRGKDHQSAFFHVL